MSVQATLEAAREKARDELETMARDLLRDHPEIDRIWSFQGAEDIVRTADVELTDAEWAQWVLDNCDEYVTAHDEYLRVFNNPGYDLYRKDASPEPSSETYEQFIKDNELTMEVRNVAARPSFGKKDPWGDDMIHFHVTISKPDRSKEFKPKRPPIIVWSGYYSVGKAHPGIWAREGCKIPGTNKRDSSAQTALRWIDNPNGLSFGRMSLHDEKHWNTVIDRYKTLAPLKLADILESLKMDSLEWDYTFEEWANDLGYDTDSKSAEAIFMACQNTAKGLRASLGVEQFERLMKLED